MKITKKFLKSLESDTVNVLQTIEKKDVIRLIDKLEKEYHEKGNNLVSDDVFDEIKDYALSKGFIKNNDVGSKVDSKDAVKLPYWMGSMDKYKPQHEKELNRWMKKYKGPYVVTDKLDGVSGLLANGVLYTRGNGSEGRNISHLIEHLKIPKEIPDNCVIRGEIILTKCDFNILADNGIEQSNPRNTVSGQTNAKKPNKDIIEYMRFIAYEVIEPRLPANEQIKFLKSKGFNTVHTENNEEISVDILTHMLKVRRKDSPFEIDGIIVTDASKNHAVNKSGNPDFAFAFKLPTQAVSTIVKNVEWKISKDKFVIPTVVCEPIALGGVTIQRATGFNAKFIIDNGIGPGAEIKIMRSGDVIPYITGVVKPVEPQMPSYKYEFTDNGLHIKVTDVEDDSELSIEIQLKQFEHTIKKLDIDGVKGGTIKKLFDAGVKDVEALFALTVEQVKSFKIAGFGDISIKSMIAGISKVKSNLDCVQLMEVSNSFGNGFAGKTLRLIYDKYPNFVNSVPKVEQLTEINGIGGVTANKFIEHIDSFKQFMKDNQLMSYCDAKEKDTTKKIAKTGKFANMKFLFTGGKDKELSAFIEKNGGSIESEWSKSINVLITAKPDTQTKKYKKAIANNTTVLSVDEFKTKYM